MTAPPDRIVVVGAGLAGLRSAQELRAQGYAGTVTVIGAEPHLPYDRPPLSKDLLLGTATPADITLLPADQEAELDVEWRLGERVTAIAGHTVTLADGTELQADGIVLTTGAVPRRLPLPDLAAVHTLRTVEDALALRAALQPGVRLTVVGAGLIGAEVAAAATTLGAAVTVVELDPAPFLRLFGAEVAGVVRGMHADHGVRLVAGTGVVTADVRGVTLTDGTRLESDVLLVAIGALPDTGYLDGSGVACRDGVLTDQAGRTNVPWIVAAGDATVYLSRRAGRIRYEHWTNARDMPPVAVRALLGHLAGEPVTAVHDPLPYFWSDQYGSRIQVAGHLSPEAVPKLIEGSLEAPQFALSYERDGVPVAAIARDSPRAFVRLRREIQRSSSA